MLYIILQSIISIISHIMSHSKHVYEISREHAILINRIKSKNVILAYSKYGTNITERNSPYITTSSKTANTDTFIQLQRDHIAEANAIISYEIERQKHISVYEEVTSNWYDTMESLINGIT